MERTQFTFYESFYKAISRMRKKADQADTLQAMARLALYGEEPDMDSLSNEVASAMELIAPVIRAGNNKAANRIKAESNENKTEQTDNKKEREKEKENKREYKNNSYKETKERYGEYKNVRLTAEELDKLKTLFSDWEERIERLSSYIASKGDHYKSHYATIRNWANKDVVKTVNKAPAVTGTDEIKRLLGSM